jgi:hypothetical protein
VNAKRGKGMLSEKPRLALASKRGLAEARDRERIRPRAFSDLFAPHASGKSQGEVCVRLLHVRGKESQGKEIDQGGGKWGESVSAKSGRSPSDALGDGV